MGRPRVRLGRLTCLLVALVAGWVSATSALAHRAGDFQRLLQDGPADGAVELDALVGLAAAAVALVLTTWLALTLAIALVSTALAGGIVARPGPLLRVAPRAVRQLAALLLGAGLVATPLGGGAVAATHRPAACPPVAVPGSGAGPAPAPSLDRPADDAPRDGVRVRPGDTLWAIASRHLGPDAGPARVAQTWPRWYRANRSVIGADPDLLIPGQSLRPPTAKEHQ